ncbi:Lysine-specific demethylase 4C [Arthrobotrys musiformis]|uniref:Lysine-specific demethylase 4C n=1 Tax=Arthrobotrys musiformis TaxID=47236 RepID=A0AAV9VRR3_9PEZI
MGTTNASLSLISDRQRPVVSLVDYQDYRISNPDNPDLSMFTMDNSGPRSALQTLLPRPESPMDQTLLRRGYHCYLLRSRNPRKGSIKPWKQRCLNAEQELANDEDAMSYIEQLSRDSLNVVESYETFTNPEVVAARVAGKAVPDFGFLRGCAIRFLSSEGFFAEFSDNLYFFRNPRLLLGGKGCTKPLGFAVSGSAAGSPKVWYVLDPKDKKGVNRFMSRHFGHRSAGFYTPDLPIYPQCEQHVSHLDVFVLPAFLEESGFTVHRIVQREGELLVTLPYANIESYNTGYSAELTSHFLLLSRTHFFENRAVCDRLCGVEEQERNNSRISYRNLRMWRCAPQQEMAPIKDFIRTRKHLLEEYSTRDLLAGELDLRARARDNEQLQEPDEPGQLEPALSDVE